MKLHVIYNQQGDIIAASKEDGKSPVPLSAPGQDTYNQFDLPTDLEGLEIQDIVRQVRVDPTSKKLTRR